LRALAGYAVERRPDPTAVTFAGAVCHHTMATPAHLFEHVETQRDRWRGEIVQVREGQARLRLLRHCPEEVSFDVGEIVQVGDCQAVLRRRRRGLRRVVVGQPMLPERAMINLTRITGIMPR
jgi:hypothetical protein